MSEIEIHWKGQPPPGSHLTIVRQGEPLSVLARELAAACRAPDVTGVQDALIQNNGLDRGAGLVPGHILDLSPLAAPAPLAGPWQTDAALANQHLQGMRPETRTFLEQCGPATSLFLALAELAQASGWSLDRETALRGAGYAVGGVSGYAAAGIKLLQSIQEAVSRLLADAVSTLGKRTLLSKSLKDLQRLELFLHRHPAFSQIQKLAKQIPDHLRRGLGPLPPRPGDLGNARWLRRQISIPQLKGSASSYFRSVGYSLDRRLLRLRRIGVGSTWVLPAILGLYNVWDAAPGDRMQVAFRESVAIPLAALGTTAGVAAGTALVLALSLSGAGAFIVVAAVATAFGSAAYWGGSVLADEISGLIWE